MMTTLMRLGALGFALVNCCLCGAADPMPVATQDIVEPPKATGSAAHGRASKKVFRPRTIGTLVLLDGKTYTDAVITAESPLHVTVRHASGMAQIEKGKLPDELFNDYPPDEKGAEREAARDAQQRAKTELEQRRRASEARAEQRAVAQRNEAIAVEQEQAAAREAEKMDALRTRVKSEFTDHFRRTWKPGSNAIYVTRLRVDIFEVEPSQGWEGTYNVKGYVDMEYYLSPGRTFNSMSRDFSGSYTERRGKREVSLDIR